MSTLNEYEQRYLAMLDELSGSAEVQVFHEERRPVSEITGDAATAFEMIADELGIHLDASLRRTYMRFDGLSSYWAIERPGVYLTGEFSIDHIATVMFDDGADELITDETPEEERQIYSELRVCDRHPRGGGGSLAGLRINPGVAKPEVWYYHGTHGVSKLDIGYDEYLDALLVTKGTYGWQYLFVEDPPVQEVEYQSALDDMRDMLQVFPELFPRHDYAPFVSRLEARR
ncbi:hypothetical protein [Streptomyces longispororuber]|uniref:hypothetical protein n=1 Tax=Streptomyces longispororuber TaxID=68230 RepID=UPI0021089AA8|nr:hypothetical protein [Streptomyces longispororuber]MCQ4212457.1 hypothetical protein [Streptomyces longispororuber]